MNDYIKMFDGRVLVEPISEEKSEKGLWIPPTSGREGLTKGKVIAPNGDKIKVGEIVIYIQIGCFPFKFNNMDFQIVNENQIVAKLYQK